VRMGLAAPGLIARGSRHVALCPGKLKGIEQFDWTFALNRPRLVPLINDAHAALLGEHWIGAARAFQHAILLTLGTGVGGAVLADGKIFRGARGWAGILGYTSLNPSGPKSDFNVPSPLEDWIGNRTVAARSEGRFADTRELLAAVSAGDKKARLIWQKSVGALAVAIASFGLIFDTEAVIIGGGIARSGAALFEPLAKELDEVEWRPGGQRMKIVPARLGEWAGAIGAARNAMDFHGRNDK
jgi:glucokinase